jgi:hypothetical protein
MEEIYELRRWDGLRWHDIYTKFPEDWCRHSSNIEVLPHQSRWLLCWYYWRKDLWSAPLRWLHAAWYSYQVSGVQAILKSCFRNFKCCNVGINGRSVLWSTPLK